MNTWLHRLKDAEKNDIKMMGFPIICYTLPLFKLGRFY